jgi:hypothetical protein
VAESRLGKLWASTHNRADPLAVTVYNPSASSQNFTVNTSRFTPSTSQSGTVTGVDETQYSTTPDQYFRWDSTAQQWIFNQATSKGTNLNVASGATYLFQITLIDGTIIGGANSSPEGHKVISTG